MHASGTARHGVERTLKYRAKDGRRDVAPVKAPAGTVDEHLLDFLGKERHFDLGAGKKSAVDIREGGEGGRKVGVALVDGRVEHLKEFDEGSAHALGGEGVEVVGEHVATAKHARIFGIEAEDEANAEHIEAAQGGGRSGVDVLREDGIVEAAYEFAGLNGHLHFAGQVGVAVVDEELQAVIVLFEVGQENHLGLSLGVFHIVNVELAEVAHHHPARTVGVRQLGGVTLGLGKGCEHRAVALTDGPREVYVLPFLLNEYAGVGDIAVR